MDKKFCKNKLKEFLLHNLNILTMDLISIVLLAIALSMDAFSVSITRGLVWNCNIKHAALIAVFFGGFQAVMPVIGWILGVQLSTYISAITPWLAFALLIFIGTKMIYESITMKEEDTCRFFSLKELLILSIATSIDALAAGVTFAFLNISIIIPIILIGVITFGLSFLGVYIGKKVGHLFESKIELLGGLILIFLGFKILLEYLF
jgi:putative Mn2+ efflux pump MntP